MTVPIPTPDVASIIGTAISKPESSKFLSKLVDTIGRGVGMLYEPTAIRRKAKAKADAEITRAKADAEIALIMEKNKSDIEILRIDERVLVRQARDRANLRLTHQEERRQENLDAIVSKAALQEPETVEDKEVEEDWVAQFIDNCKDVSDEDMQTIWARILAGEVAKPGSFSLRTLALVRTMSRDEADLFTRFCSLIWYVEEENMAFPLTHDLNRLKSIPGIEISFDDFVRLDSLGLIRFESGGGLYHTPRTLIPVPDTEDYYQIISTWRYHGIRHIFRRRVRGNKQANLDYDIYYPTTCIAIKHSMLTDIGRQLVSIAGATANEEYRKHVISVFTQFAWYVTEEPIESGTAEAHQLIDPKAEKRTRKTSRARPRRKDKEG